MEYQKVGRGGAGNYYSHDDIARASKSTEDLEAHRIAAGPSAEDIEKTRSGYAHSGRGGAGNYTDAAKLAETTAQTTGVTPSLEESKPPQTGYYGRGGAGNYRTSEAEKVERERRAAEVHAEMHEQVVKDVESGLKEPERAHLGGEKIHFKFPSS